MAEAGGRLALRPYQRAAVEAALAEFRAGRRRTLIVAPTGAGKTWIEGELAAWALAEGRRVLVLAHREELIEQHERLARTVVLPAVGGGFGVGVEQAARRAAPMDSIVIGSVPTLGGPRCRRWEYLGEWGLVVLDEAHHAAADTYQRALARAGCFRPDGPYLVGFTATPQRADGVGLGHIFDSIAYAVDLGDLTRQGYLCPLRAYTIDTGVVLDRIRVRGGDFDEAELARTVDTPPRNRAAVEAYRAWTDGQPAIAFCADRRHVEHVTETFRAAGIAAAAVTGDMPRELRRDRLRRFHEGALRVLVNCAVLGEGWDAPAAAVAILLRPTRSLPVLAQQIGRVLRPAPGKTVATALDLVDVCRDGGLRTVATLVGLPPRIRFRGEVLLDASRRLEAALEAAPWAAAAVEAANLVSVDDVLAAARAVNLLYAELPMPAEFRQARYGWIAVPPARWVLPAPSGTLAIRQTVLDYRVAWRPRQGDPEPVAQTLTLADAIDAAERWARRRLDPRALSILDRGAAWRRRPATESQRRLLDRLGIDYDGGTTAEAASRAIARRLSGLNAAALRRLVAPGRPTAADEGGSWDAERHRAPAR